jgi:hypothetical protein
LLNKDNCDLELQALIQTPNKFFYSPNKSVF